MRLVALALAVAITASACGGRTPAPSEPDAEDDGGSDDEGPFVHRRGFEPTAFVVEVRGEGRPVIFIPGVACPGSVWDDTIDRLDGVEAHVLTLSGFAGTKPTRPPLLAKTRHELVRYIRSNRLEDAIVVGHSLGGFIAYWLAATAPDIVGGIVVVDAGPKYFAGDESARRLRNTWVLADDEELRLRVRRVFQYMARNRARMERFIPTIAKSDRRTIGDAVYELVKLDIREQVRGITAPVLLVLADGGLKHRYRRQAEGIEDLEVVVVPKTGHFVMFDAPEQFVRILTRFIAKIDGEAAED